MWGTAYLKANSPDAVTPKTFIQINSVPKYVKFRNVFKKMSIYQSSCLSHLNSFIRLCSHICHMTVTVWSSERLESRTSYSVLSMVCSPFNGTKLEKIVFAKLQIAGSYVM